MTGAPPPVVEARGGDAQLADVVKDRPGVPIRFVPDASSDLARALGLRASGSGPSEGTEWILDVLRVDETGIAVNMVVLGHAPDRRSLAPLRLRCQVEVDGRVRWEGPAATVLVANGEYLRGRDVVPRGHPGDGRLEVHVHALGGRQRRAMRTRLATGTHVPHPEITTVQGTAAIVRWSRPVTCEVDGVVQGKAQEVSIRVDPGALRLLA